MDYQYRTTAGKFAALPADGSRPANMSQTTLLDGRTVDYVVRRERGTINRFIYSFAMLAPFGESRGGTGHLALEQAAHLHLRRRRGDRPEPGHTGR